MRTSILLGGLLSLAAAADAASTLHGLHRTIMHQLRGIPEGWRADSKPSEDTRIAFRIAMQQPDPKLLSQTLYEVSTPGSARYGQHLKRHELKDLLKPAQEATDSVIEWLTENGIHADEIDNNGEWINFVATVQQAEVLLDTEYKTYRSTVRDGVAKIRTLEYSVPDAIQGFIRTIQPTTRFGQIRPETSNIFKIESIADVPEAVSSKNEGEEVDQSTCATEVTPQCLKTLYKVGDFQASADNGNLLGITGYLEQYAKFNDLEEFESLYATYANGQNFTYQSVAGGLEGAEAQNSDARSSEANLDIQYTIGLSAPTVNKFFSVAGRGVLIPDLDQPNPANNGNEPYLDLFTYLSNLPDEELPSVLTTSYGENEQSVPADFARTVCDMIGGLGARGVTVIFSSGDSGTGTSCQSNDGKNTTLFQPVFPAACPYVTAVGGTTGIEPEKAIAFSSGGFSQIFPRPAYQDAAIEKYLGILGDRWKGLYNPEGRGFPDLAAQSNHFHVIDKGDDVLVGGTSASAPAVAGIIALLNSARKDAGKPYLGFLNPWLYSEGYKGLTDIIDGGSRGCTGRSGAGLPSPKVPFASWNATEGWDPVTGYGTPLFDKLLELSLGQNGGGYGTAPPS